MRTRSPRALSSPKSSAASLGPSTAWEPWRRGSMAGRKEPWPTSKLQVSGSLVVDAVDVDAPSPASALDPGLAHDHRHEVLHPGQLPQGLGIVDVELVGGPAEMPGMPDGLDLAGVDGDRGWCRTG